MSRKPNIIIVTGAGIREAEGERLISAAIVQRFVDVVKPVANHVHVLTGNLPIETEDKVSVVTLGEHGRQSWGFLSFIRFLTAQLTICWYLAKSSRESDIVIFHLGTTPFVLPMPVAKLLRKQTVSCATGRASTYASRDYRSMLWGGGSFIAPFLFRFAENINFRLADQIAVESPSVVEFLGLERYRDKIVVNGAPYIDLDLFKPIVPLAYRRRSIGFVGRLVQAKGVMQFSQAMPLVRKEQNDVEFSIVGGGPLLAAIQSQLTTSDMNSERILLGWMAHAELPKHLNTLKLLVLPSYSEGLPNIVKEAMACGTPVLATAVGGIPDLIRDGETGFLMENNSSECIAENILRALNWPDLEQISVNARELIEKEYSYQASVERCVRAINQIY